MLKVLLVQGHMLGAKPFLESIQFYGISLILFEPQCVKLDYCTDWITPGSDMAYVYVKTAPNFSRNFEPCYFLFDNNTIEATFAQQVA